MKSFARELADRSVLSPEDILKLKNYIAAKYKDNSSREKAQILANAVHRVVDNNLPEVEGDYRAIIRQQLMNKTIKGKEHTISMYDIFNTCISLEVKSKDFVNGLVSWINLNVENKITDNEIYEYNNNQTYNIEVSQKALNIDTSNYEKPLQTERIREIDKASKILNYKYAVCLSCIIAIIVSSFILFNAPCSDNKHIGGVKTNSFVINYFKEYKTRQSEPIPINFKFKNVNRQVIKKYLQTKRSLLRKEPYFSTIIAVAKEYDINPLVLFAIAGQEQGFVPQIRGVSRSIANNPFNVYHSWKEYNTSISDATKIVCATLLNLSKNRPSNVEPFVWINRKYAQDQNWAHGVNLIYNKLEKINKTFEVVE